jgi:hypothetical protein
MGWKWDAKSGTPIYQQIESRPIPGQFVTGQAIGIEGIQGINGE